MHFDRLKFAAFLVCASLVGTAPLLARKKDRTVSNSSEQQRALHAINRLTFGPRPGDVQQVMTMGVDRWIDLQLHPEKMDDSALNARLESFVTLRMSTQQIAEEFPDQQEINQVMNGKRPMPTDPARRAIYQAQLIRLEERKERKEEAAKNATLTASAKNLTMEKNTTDGTQLSGENSAADYSVANTSAMSGNMNDSKGEMSSRSVGSDVAESADVEIQQLPSLPPDDRFQKVLSMPPAAQVAFAESFRGGKGQEFLEGLSPKQKETLLAMNNPTQVVTSELVQAKLLRAVYGQRQLDEVMTDFWLNHFNVFLDKGLDRLMLTSYERDVIRLHALGRFEDLLVATAKSPAMLFYLDNWLSVGPNSPQALGIPAHPNGPARGYPPKQNQGKHPSGLNENYGRELLELHTLSVNGGYSQRDVTEVAKVFTGWTIDRPAQGGGFKFEPRMHEPGPKFVLGHRIKPKGEAEGLEVLHRLATSPRTAHFISLKLAQRFVSDDPPPDLVDRMAKTFLKKKGDIREVLTVLFHSPEFWDEGNYRNKVKTPVEFVASTLRATAAEVDNAMPLTQQLNRMGMPLYGAQPPTGYSMKAQTWVSSSALLNRMNFALALTSGRIKGVKVDASQLTGTSIAPSDSAEILSTLESSLLAGGISKQTHDSIVAQIEAGQEAVPRKHDATGAAEINTITGLLLGSPEFQRR